MMGVNSIPRWVEVLLGQKFFNSCILHQDEKKNEENTFCLDCCISLCPHCLAPHRTHNLLQIRRYVYQDVLRLKDAEKLMDCSSVQSYTTNSAKVVFLNQRPLTRQFKGCRSLCILCHRNLQDPFLFCSISCKVNYMVSSKNSLKDQYFFKYGGGLIELESTQMSPDTVLDEMPQRTSSASTSMGPNPLDCRALLCTATTDFVRKKRTPVVVHRTRPPCLPPAEVSAGSSRRKGVPHRSPMY
ncbi:hypothetical protein LguiA_034172 [Lonicera macranthoides]